MDEWLKKLLAGISERPGTPPFVQTGGNGGVVAPPPVAPQPAPTTIPQAPVAPYGDIPQQPIAPAVDPLQDALGKARGDYQKAVTDPANKQNPWLQGIFLGLQGLQRVADPSNPQNAKPIEWLGNAKKAARVNQAAGVLAPLEQQQEQILGENYKKAQTKNFYDDNERQAREFNERMKYNRDEQSRKIGDRTARERTSRMNAVAGMFKNIPSIDIESPQFAELKKAMGDVNLPITSKDAKKNVKLIQDQRTGAWSTVLTDPVTGTQETRDVVKDGKPFTSTPTVVMQGELGLLKQNDQQDFTAEQNAIERAETAARDAAKERFNIEFENMKATQGEAAARARATEAYKRVYLNKHGKNPSQADIDAYLSNIQN